MVTTIMVVLMPANSVFITLTAFATAAMSAAMVVMIMMQELLMMMNDAMAA